eukprot:355907-Chlamydomonas_euryale.AAC.3
MVFFLVDCQWTGLWGTPERCGVAATECGVSIVARRGHDLSMQIPEQPVQPTQAPPLPACTRPRVTPSTRPYASATLEASCVRLEAGTAAAAPAEPGCSTRRLFPYCPRFVVERRSLSWAWARVRNRFSQTRQRVKGGSDRV